jgi:hypothetical protein
MIDDTQKRCTHQLINGSDSDEMRFLAVITSVSPVVANTRIQTKWAYMDSFLRKKMENQP